MPDETLATAVADGLSRIDQGLEEIGRPQPTRRAATLTVSVTPDFASKWLLPRLTRFQDTHPEIEVRVTAEHRFADFVSDGVDLGIRFGAGINPGLQHPAADARCGLSGLQPCLVERVRTVCFSGRSCCRELLHDVTAEHDGSGCDWRHWFEHTGIAVEPARRPASQPRKARDRIAADGLGVALARATLIGNDLTEGRLVRPLHQTATTAFSYYLVHRSSRSSTPMSVAFIAWLRSEAARWLVSEDQAEDAPVKQDNAAPPAARRPIAKRAS